MSVYIVRMPSPGLRLSPPVSNVMPLPTSTTWTPWPAPRGRHAPRSAAAAPPTRRRRRARRRTGARAARPRRARATVDARAAPSSRGGLVRQPGRGLRRRPGCWRGRGPMRSRRPLRRPRSSAAASSAPDSSTSPARAGRGGRVKPVAAEQQALDERGQRAAPRSPAGQRPSALAVSSRASTRRPRRRSSAGAADVRPVGRLARPGGGVGTGRASPRAPDRASPDSTRPRPSVRRSGAGETCRT